jgi:2-isopropylmalate synthase
MLTDDTLREGMQAPNICFSPTEKFELAKEISRCGIEKILISYPPAHHSEVEVTLKVVESKIFKEVYGLGRITKEDIDTIYSSGANISLHFPFQYDNLEKILENVKYATSLQRKVEVSVVDITQYPLNSLLKIVELLSNLGVDTIQLPDTLGRACPKMIERYVRACKKVSKADIELHCHNDRGLAVANSIAGIQAGADSVDVSFLGIGERNGIADTLTMARYLKECGYPVNFHLDNMIELSKKLFGIVLRKAGEHFFGDNLPNIGPNKEIHTAGTHAAFKDVFKGELFSVNVYTGTAMIRTILESNGIKLSEEKLRELVYAIKDKSSKEGRSIKIDEIIKEATSFVQGH